MKLRLSIRDNAFGHSPVAMGPTPAVAHSDKVEWDRTSPEGPDTVYTDALIRGCPEDRRIWLIEPLVHNEDLYEYVLANRRRYREIWTHDKEVIDRCSNARFVPAGGCWIRPEDRQLWPKTKTVSIIASHARGTEGQKMRHEAIARFPEIDAYGPGYRVLPDKPGHKIDGLRDYRFQLAFESSNRDSFFTEKLIDCFATGTIPVYFGCRSIVNYFNPMGVIACDDINDLGGNMIEFCTKRWYDRCALAILDNFERAKKFYLVEDWIHDMLTK